MIYFYNLFLLLQPIYEIVACDEEIKKIQNQISGGMGNNATNLQNYLTTWDQYREIWEINKDAFIRRYQKLQPQVSSFDADIARYSYIHYDVTTHQHLTVETKVIIRLIMRTIQGPVTICWHLLL